MERDNRQIAYENLIALAEIQWYVTFDNIMDCADEYSLSIQDFDWLSSSITTRGILVYSEPPSQANASSTEVDFYDYAQSDYDDVFDRIIKLDSSLEPLVSTVRNIIPPQRGEIGRLKYQVVDGNLYARKRMIEMHLRLALKVALQRAETYDIDIEDAVGYAFIGLVTAVDKYDPDTNDAFSSYATLWMLQNISREQETRRPSIYYPVHVKEKCFAAYPLLKQYGCTECEELGKCSESVQLISKELECSYEEAEFIRSTVVPDISMDELLYDADSEEDKDGFILSNFSAKSILCEEDMYLLIRSGLVSEEISKILDVLTQKEREIVNLRFGLNGRPHTLDEIGHMRNLTRERIRQIEKNALCKLKRQAKCTSLAELYFD